MKQRFFFLVLVFAGALAIWGLQRNSPARRGERAFTRLGCSGCHFSGAGPNLTHVVRKHDRILLAHFILDPPSVYRQRNGQPLNAGYMLMPKQNASLNDVRDILAYLDELDRSDKQK